MSGSSVLKDGRTILEEYGTDLDKLKEGDVVGVGLDAGAGGGATGDLHFYVNGVDQVLTCINNKQWVNDFRHEIYGSSL